MTQPAFAAPVCVEIVVTADSPELLDEIVQALVKERLVAYGYNTSPIRAVYRHRGELHNETHARASLHTRATLVSDVIDRLDHDYANGVRSVVTTQLVDGRSDYLQWVAHETAPDIDHHAAAERRRAERRDGRIHWSWNR